MTSTGLWVYSEFFSCVFGYGIFLQSPVPPVIISKRFDLYITRGAFRLQRTVCHSFPVSGGVPMSFGQGKWGYVVGEANGTFLDNGPLGFSVDDSYSGIPKKGDLRVVGLTIPFWACMAVSAILPAYSLLKTRGRQRRRKLGLCALCGYDLRATSYRCPECGTVTPK